MLVTHGDEEFGGKGIATKPWKCLEISEGEYGKIHALWTQQSVWTVNILWRRWDLYGRQIGMSTGFGRSPRKRYPRKVK